MEDLTWLGGSAVVVLTVLGLARYLLLDRTLTKSLKLDLLQARERTAYWEGVANTERTAKHEVINKLTYAQGTLDLLDRLGDKCTCGALGPMDELVSRTLRRLRDSR